MYRTNFRTGFKVLIKKKITWTFSGAHKFIKVYLFLNFQFKWYLLWVDILYMLRICYIYRRVLKIGNWAFIVIDTVDSHHAVSFNSSTQSSDQFVHNVYSYLSHITLSNTFFNLKRKVDNIQSISISIYWSSEREKNYSIIWITIFIFAIA